MRKITSDEFQRMKDWYSEWIKYPQYVTSASLLLLSFSLTNFVINRSVSMASTNIEYLKICWILLCISALLSSFGLVAVYIVFNMAAAYHLRGLLALFNMRLPISSKSWIVRLCWIAWVNVVLGVIFMLTGTLFLVLFTFHSLNV